MEKTLQDFIPLNEGVYDPGIFKAVFLAGGPGSGKSFIVGQTALPALGLKLVNSDQAFERALELAGLEPTQDNIFSSKGQSIRDRAKFVTNKRKQGFVDGRLGLTIDGTGRDVKKILSQKTELEKLGYQTAMIFVNTDLNTAIDRDKARQRTLGKDQVSPMWRAVQNNIGQFQQHFRHNMFIVDNSTDADYKTQTLDVYRKIGAWIRSAPTSNKAKKWINNQMAIKRSLKPTKFSRMGEQLNKAQYALSGIDEEDIGRNGSVIKNRIGKSSQQRKAEKKKQKIKTLSIKIDEKIKDMEMGEVIKDFYKSDAPQFKGKSKKKRREMAVAAKLATECVDEKDFKPHMMYDPKTGKGYMAKKYEDHVKMDKKGYVHEKPEVKEAYKKLSAQQRFNNRLKSKHGIDLDANAKYYKSVADKYRQKIKDAEVKKEEKEKGLDGKPCWKGYKLQGTKKKGGKTVDNCVKAEEIVPRYMKRPIGKIVHKKKYEYALKLLKDLLARKRRESGGHMRHADNYYAAQIIRSTFPKYLDSKVLVGMLGETAEYKAAMGPGSHEWGTPQGTEYFKKLTPGQSTQDDYKETNSKEFLEIPKDFEFSEVEIAQMETDIDNLTFDDMIKLDMYDPEELQDIEDSAAFESLPPNDISSSDEEVQIIEVLSIQGRMKRRFAARRNRQKLKVARMRASRRAADPARIKKRATRGARNIIKARFARGRDMSAMPPQEKARIEAMAKRFAPLVQRLAVRMVPQVRKNELARIKKGSAGKPQKAKKFKVSKGGSASKYAAKKLKVAKKK